MMWVRRNSLIDWGRVSRRVERIWHKPLLDQAIRVGSGHRRFPAVG